MTVVTTDILFYNLADYAWTGDNPFYDSDAPTIPVGNSFAFTSVAAPQVLTITDLTGGDMALTDKDTVSEQYVDFADPAQTFEAESGTYGNGTQIETAWRYTVSGSDGSEITLWGVTLNQADNDVQGLVSTATLQPGVTYTILADPPPSKTGGAGFNDIACFAAGTLIDTPGGPRPIEALHPGDLLRTLDAGWQPLRWITRQAVSAAQLRDKPKLAPWRISAGALGPGRPQRDLLLSSQHRVLVSSAIARRMFGQDQVLVPVKDLAGLDGVSQADPGTGLRYLHLLLDNHQVLVAAGLWAESLFPGPMALNSLGPLPCLAVAGQGPKGATPVAPSPARPFVQGRRARQLAARHRKNNQALQGGIIGAGSDCPGQVHSY